MHVFRAARPNDLVDTIFDDGEFASVEDHANARIWKVKLFVSRAAPWQFTHCACFEVTQENGGVGVSNEESILIHVDLVDLVSLRRLENHVLTSFDPLDNNLTERNVGEFKLAFVAWFFQTHVKDVYGTAKRSNTNFWAVMFPGYSRDWVIVLDLLAANLVPGGPLWVEAKRVKAVEISNHNCLARSVELGAGKLFNALIFRVVKNAESVTRSLIESDLAVISGGNNVHTPCKAVRDCGVHNARFSLRVKVHRNNGTVKEPSGHVLAIRWRSHWDAEVILGEDTLRLVGLEDTNLDFSFGETNNQLVMAFARPSHTGNWRSLGKLVANGLFVTPFGAKAIHKHDVVGLGNSKALGVRWKGKSPHNVRAVFFVCGSDREFVSLVTQIVVKVNYAVWCRNSLSLGVGGPSDGWNFLHSVNGGLQISPVLYLHFSLYLFFTITRFKSEKCRHFLLFTRQT